MARADITVINTANGGVGYSGGGTSYIVQKNGAVDTYYLIYTDSASDVSYLKSVDGGFTWAPAVNVYTGTVRAIAIWYDRWSGIAADVIHIAYVEDTGNNILYRSLDISSDTLGTETTVFDGTSAAGGGALSITVARNGHIRVAGSIDAGVEDGAWSSTDSGATWGDTIADPSEGATQDQYWLFPGWNADTADTMLIFWDASANEISVKRYDDSANTWTETSISVGFSDLTAGNGFPQLAGFVDLANSRNVIAAWSNSDLANADLRCFIIDDTTITETATNIVLNSGDDQSWVGMLLDTDTGTWYAIYGGKSDGSETFSSAIKYYYKTSDDAGATWSAETALTAFVRSSQQLIVTPRFSTNFLAVYYVDTSTDHLMASVNLPSGSGGGNANLLAGKL